MAKEKEFNYHNASAVDLEQRLNKTQQDLFKLRFRAASAPVKNTMQVRFLKKEVARINTFLTQQKKGEKKS